MVKDELIKHFSYRLREAMVTAGYDSPRSPSGVNLHKLKEITGYSLQICRKYVRGEALPEISKIVDIAHQLEISPGWLLFGEPYCKKGDASHYLTINTRLLHYLYKEVGRLYFNDPACEEMADFLLAVTKDLSEISANETQLKRIVDLALSSANHFRAPHQIHFKHKS